MWQRRHNLLDTWKQLWPASVRETNYETSWLNKQQISKLCCFFLLSLHLCILLYSLFLSFFSFILLLGALFHFNFHSHSLHHASPQSLLFLLPEMNVPAIVYSLWSYIETHTHTHETSQFSPVWDIEAHSFINEGTWSKKIMLHTHRPLWMMNWQMKETRQKIASFYSSSSSSAAAAAAAHADASLAWPCSVISSAGEQILVQSTHSKNRHVETVKDKSLKWLPFWFRSDCGQLRDNRNKGYNSEQNKCSWFCQMKASSLSLKVSSCSSCFRCLSILLLLSPPLYSVVCIALLFFFASLATFQTHRVKVTDGLNTLDDTRKDAHTQREKGKCAPLPFNIVSIDSRHPSIDSFTHNCINCIIERKMKQVTFRDDCNFLSFFLLLALSCKCNDEQRKTTEWTSYRVRMVPNVVSIEHTTYNTSTGQ